MNWFNNIFSSQPQSIWAAYRNKFTWLNATWIDPTIFSSEPSKVVNLLWHNLIGIPNCEANDKIIIKQATAVCTFMSMLLLFIKHLKNPCYLHSHCCSHSTTNCQHIQSCSEIHLRWPIGYHF